jgi:hypothetical protein
MTPLGESTAFAAPVAIAVAMQAASRGMRITREICGITEKGRVEWIIASPLLGKIGEREA